MSIITLIIGESGSGKSTAIRTLDPTETFVINVLDKPLPFRGYKKIYKSKVNYLASDEHYQILRTIKYINEKMPHIKNVIIDDFQYLMANEFMRRAKERGFDKFTEIAQNAWSVIADAQLCRDDLYFFFLSHNELDATGKMKCKTIGKMLDDKITIEGMFTVVLHALINDGQYKFLTQNNGTYIAKSPMGMFEDVVVDNDLQLVKNSMVTYYDEGAQDEPV